MSKLGVLIWRKIFESGDAKRIAAQAQSTADLVIERDIPYLNDGDRGHRLDLYRLPEADEKAPVMINIHGGGLFASYKEVNAHYNYEWARMGYRVVSISYRRIPETTLWHQIDDCMAALRYLVENRDFLELDLDNCLLTGDSAGALLSLYMLALEASRPLQEAFGIRPSGIPFKAAGLISIMLRTQRKDLMRAISDQVTGPEDAGRAYLPYLMDPTLLIPRIAESGRTVPIYQITSAEDLIREDSLQLESLLTGYGLPHEIHDFEKGEERQLVHVFSVAYPLYPESRQVFKEIDGYFKGQGE